jgi:hypothetical protein
MASPLFRNHDLNLAGWKIGSNKIVGFKMAVWKHRKNIPPLPPAFEMYLIVFPVYLKKCTSLNWYSQFLPYNSHKCGT